MTILNGEYMKNQPKGWAVVNVFKRLIGIVIMFAILKMIVFPSSGAPTEAELLKKAQRDFRLDEQEIEHIKKFETLEEQRDAYKSIYMHKVRKQQKEFHT